METDTRTVWADSIDAEIGFWSRTIAKDPGRFQRRYLRSAPANSLLPGLVTLVEAEPVAVLDVGSGPAPVVLGRYAKRVDIVACDPLADQYQKLLEQHGITSPVEIVNAEGEGLVEQFGAERFHISHIQNALDHSHQPVEVVRNMLRCTKPGGIVMIRTVINEGANEHYHGLHQWDISPAANDFHIRHKDGAVTAVREALADDVQLLLQGMHCSRYGDKLQDWMDVVLIKKGASAEFVRQVESHFFATQIELGRGLAGDDGGVARLRSQIARLTAEKAAVEQSKACRLGQLLLGARRSPARLVSLPRDLLRLRMSQS